MEGPDIEQDVAGDQQPEGAEREAGDNTRQDSKRFLEVGICWQHPAEVGGVVVVSIIVIRVCEERGAFGTFGHSVFQIQNWCRGLSYSMYELFLNWDRNAEMVRKD